MALAFVFPGQGSQAVGMGRELAQESRAARLVFEAVDEALAPDGGRPLSSIAWEGPADELTRTANAQPAIMAASIAALRAAEEAAGGSILQRARFVAGHSLGEYSALAAAGALDLGDCARLLRARGQAMQAAVPQGRGAMAAVIGLELAAIREVLDCLPEAGVAEIANDNAPGQATISGDAAAIAGAAERCRAAGAKRAVPLDVSAPFHCALMAPAASVMRDRLAETEIRTPVIPVVTNVTARPVDDPDEIRALLVRQVTGLVRWRESIAWMAEQGVDRFVELGAGRVLSGLVRRTVRGVGVKSVGAPAAARELADDLAG